MTQSTNGVTLRLRAKGRVEFTDDDADVRSLSPGGRFTVERSTGRFFGESQRFEVRAAGDGTLSRTYTKNGSTLDPAEGRKWLATFLPGLLRDMGVNANKRVARHLSQGGPAAVLDLVDRITTSQGKGAHLRELYRQAALDPAALARSLEGAARGIESDFEMAQVLTAAAERQPVDAAMQAWVRAAGTIGSDFEQRRVVSAALARPGLTPAEAAATLGAATPGAGRDGIRSDFELAEVLIGAPPGVIASAPDAWFDAIGTIQSAFERRRALTAAVARESAQLTPRVLEAAQGIGSDFERAELLVTVLRSGNVAESAMPQLAAAVRGVRSDFERARVLKAAARASLTDAGLAQVIVTAGEIRSDFESAEALIALARSPAVGPEARKALAAAAERIGSRHERGRVLSELVRVGVLTASE